MSFGLEQIKELRERTGAGIMDCKNALKESEGDVNQALEVLRTKGLAKAAKKSSRSANEGMIYCCSSSDGKKAAILEVNCETDFVARTDQFKAFVAEATQAILDNCPADQAALKAVKVGGKPAGESLTDLIARLGENMDFGRFAILAVDAPGQVGLYVHSGSKIGVLVAMEADNDEVTSGEGFGEALKDVCLQVCASSPECVVREDVPVDLLEAEKRVLTEQALASGKPEKIVGKIVEGRLRKFYERVVLLEQPFIKDTDISVDRYLAQKVAELGGKVQVKEIVRFAIGEA